MKLKTIIFLSLMFVLWSSVSILCFSMNYEVIVNKSQPDQELSARDAQKIFLGEKTTWLDGTPIKLAVLKGGGTHRLFLKNILKVTPMQFSILWKQKLYTGSGTGTDIKYFKSDDKVKEYVAANPGAIGYISSESLDDTVKKLTIKTE